MKNIFIINGSLRARMPKVMKPALWW